MRSSASVRLRCPSMQFSQVGELASSKSAMNTRAPELSALITIFRSTGPVISTRRSAISSGNGAIRQSPSRTDAVSVRKSGSSPPASRAWRSARRASSSARPSRNSRSRSVRNSTPSGVRTSSVRTRRYLARSTRGAGQSCSWSRSQCSGHVHGATSARVRIVGRAAAVGGRGRLRLHGLLTDQHAAAAHAALLSAWNCCSSVEPVRARVDETPPETASMTLSKYPAPTSRWWRVAV